MRWSWCLSLSVAAAACTEPAQAPTCSFDDADDAGLAPAMFAQRCNVPGSMGQRKWFRAAATVPGTTDVVQLELYEQAGVFAGGAVRTGTFPIEPDAGACGVCVRALGDRDGDGEQEYRAIEGTVTISEVGASGSTLRAMIVGAKLVDVADGTCTSSVARIELAGTVVDVGGGGGGGGAGGGMACPTTVGDATP